MEDWGFEEVEKIEWINGREVDGMEIFGEERGGKVKGYRVSKGICGAWECFKGEWKMGTFTKGTILNLQRFELIKGRFSNNLIEGFAERYENSDIHFPKEKVSKNLKKHLVDKTFNKHFFNDWKTKIKQNATTIYKGYMSKGLYHGKGKLIKNSCHTSHNSFSHLQPLKDLTSFPYQTTFIYIGEFKRGLFHGKGSLTTPSKIFYGTFEYNLRSGFGYELQSPTPSLQVCAHLENFVESQQLNEPQIISLLQTLKNDSFLSIGLFINDEFFDGLKIHTNP